MVSGCTLCCFLWGFLSTRSPFVQREGWKCLWTLVRRASSLLSPWLLCGLKMQEQPSRGGRLLPAPLLPRLALPTHHCMLCEVMCRECLRRTAPVLVPPVLPGLLAEKHRRIVDPALTGCGFRTAAGLVGVALAGTGLGLLTATGPGASVRIPLFARGIVVTS